MVDEICKESVLIADKWNEFIIECHKSKIGHVFILNYIVIVLEQIGDSNKLTFDEMIHSIKKIKERGMYKDFIK